MNANTPPKHEPTQIVQNILRQEFRSEDSQFKDIRRGGRAFVFQAQLNDPHMSSEFVVKNIRPSIF